MAKGSNILGIGLIGGALLYLGGKAFNIKEAVKKLSVSNPKITAKPNIKGLNILIDISLQIFNPGSVDIPFEYYAGTLIYDTTKIADFNFNGNGKAIILKARSKTPLAFQVSVTNVNTAYKLLQVIKAIKKNLPVDTKIAVNSSIYAAGLDVPVNFIYDLKKLEVISGIGRARFFQKAAQAIVQRAAFRKQRRMAPVPVVVPPPPPPVLEAAAEVTPPIENNSVEGYVGEAGYSEIKIWFFSNDLPENKVFFTNIIRKIRKKNGFQTQGELYVEKRLRIDPISKKRKVMPFVSTFIQDDNLNGDDLKKLWYNEFVRMYPNAKWQYKANIWGIDVLKNSTD